MLSTMTSVLDEAYDDDAVRCIVISAKGPVFCGHDLSEMARGEDETKDEWRPRILTVLEACATMMQRIVTAQGGNRLCAGNGYCGGVPVSRLDMAVASSDSKFALPVSI